MAHLRIRIEEMEYRTDEKSLVILAVDQFHQIVTLEISPVFPRQMAADLDFVARNPGARVTAGGADAETSTFDSSGTMRLRQGFFP